MGSQVDIPLRFHHSFNDLLDAFRNAIASITWLKASGSQAQTFFAPYPYVIELACSTTDLLIKVDKSILTAIQAEGFDQVTPLFTDTLIGLYRIITVAVMDIIRGEQEFQPLLQRADLQFLRHIRNASAHGNKFYFGIGTERERTLKKLPVVWRGKVIDEKLEGARLYMDYMAPGDLFLLLADICAIGADGALTRST